MQRMAQPDAVEEVLDRPDRTEQGTQPAVIEVTEWSRPAVLGGHQSGKPSSHLAPPNRVYPQVVHNGGNLGDKFGPWRAKFVDRRLVGIRPWAVHFVLPEGAGVNRQTGSRSDPRDGPGNQVRGSQGSRTRDSAATRDCGLLKPLDPSNGGHSPVPSGASMSVASSAAPGASGADPQAATAPPIG